MALYFDIYMLLHNDLIKDHVDLVMLRSTTDSYERLVLEVAYGETLFSLHRGCIRVDSREEWLGCRHDARPCSTSLGQHQCGLSIYIIFRFS